MENNSDQIPQENISEINKPANTVNPLFYVILSVLFILLVIIAIMYFDQRKKADRIIAEMTQTTIEKDNLPRELDDLLVEYETMKTDNDSLNVQMKVEQEKIKQMLYEVKRVKATNVTLIAQYKKELATLRKIMRGYIVQIDSLNTLNIHLMDENVKVKNQFNQVQREYESLSEKTETLSSKVEVASIIQTENLEAVAINKNSKPVTKAKKVDKFKVCMTLDENPIAKAGLKDVYIRISNPEELVLASSSEDLFTFEGEQIVYSAMRQVEYLNIDIDLCIYWQSNQQLFSGDYLFEVFTEGNLIGTTSLFLK